MTPRPPRTTRTHTPFPYTTLFRSVGALQFLPDTVAPDEIAKTGGKIEGVPVSEADIGRIVGNLARAPLGLNEDDDFRISVAGVQEKTALLLADRSEEHTSELQSLMRISSAVFCLKKKNYITR